MPGKRLQCVRKRNLISSTNLVRVKKSDSTSQRLLYKKYPTALVAQAHRIFVDILYKENLTALAAHRIFVDILYKENSVALIAN